MERRVEIRVRVMGEKDNKTSWKVYPPLVLDVEGQKGKLGALTKRWNPSKSAFYIHSDHELMDLIKALSKGIVEWRLSKKAGVSADCVSGDTI